MAMGETLRVRWRLRPCESPKIWRHCRRCDDKRPFATTEKFRVNAQKKRLDAWLIYRCLHCGQTWNRPVFERRPVADFDAQTIQAIMENDPQVARRIANDVPRPARRADQANADYRLDRRMEGEPPPAPVAALITIQVEAAPGPRLDRLLARELGLSRARLGRLHACQALSLSPPGRSALRRAVRDGQRVCLDLRGLEEAPAVIAAVSNRASCRPDRPGARRADSGPGCR